MEYGTQQSDPRSGESDEPLRGRGDGEKRCVVQSMFILQVAESLEYSMCSGSGENVQSDRKRSSCK